MQLKKRETVTSLTSEFDVLDNLVLQDYKKTKEVSIRESWKYVQIKLHIELSTL